MTTKVTIDAHAGWDVQVTHFYKGQDVPSVIIVPKNTIKDLAVWDGLELHIKEIQPTQNNVQEN